MELLKTMRCDNPTCGERADDELETLDSALDEGWIVLRTSEGDWDYCSVDCLKEHL